MILVDVAAVEVRHLTVNEKLVELIDVLEGSLAIARAIAAWASPGHEKNRLMPLLLEGSVERKKLLHRVVVGLAAVESHPDVSQREEYSLGHLHSCALCASATSSTRSASRGFLPISTM